MELWLAEGFLLLLMCLGGPTLIRLWRGELDASNPPSGWPYSRNTWRRCIRAAPAMAVTGYLLFLVPIGFLFSTTIGLTVTFLWVLAFLHGLSVFLFKRPAFLVPPSLRSEGTCGS